MAQTILQHFFIKGINMLKVKPVDFYNSISKTCSCFGLLTHEKTYLQQSIFFNIVKVRINRYKWLPKCRGVFSGPELHPYRMGPARCLLQHSSALPGVHGRALHLRRQRAHGWQLCLQVCWEQNSVRGSHQNTTAIQGHQLLQRCYRRQTSPGLWRFVNNSVRSLQPSDSVSPGRAAAHCNNLPPFRSHIHGWQLSRGAAGFWHGTVPS